MSNAHFAKVPNINIPRSKFKMDHSLVTTFNHGQLIPILCMPVLPGDTFKIDLSSLIRMSTPIFPIMDNIDLYAHAFFIPMRLVWEDTEAFFGENKESSGYVDVNDYEIPYEVMFTSEEPYGGVDNTTAPLSLAAYLGYQFKEGLSDDYFKLGQSLLPARCYWLVWSEWYRAQQLQDPFICDKSSGTFFFSDYGVGSIGSKTLGVVFDQDDIIFPAQVCKKFDYFTAATISPQYGDSVTLPLGTYAPIIIEGTGVNAAISPGSDLSLVNSSGIYASSKDVSNLEIWSTNASVTSRTADIYADLSQATAATINSIRYAFQVQKYLERSNFGSRFFEMLAVHYGVTSPDSRLQRPEYLGGTSFRININQVLSTAGYAAGSTTQVGQTGAVSVTANKSHLFTKGFVEPGYLMILVSTKHDQTYCQGIPRDYLKRSRFEIYSPEFANLGDQEIRDAEIYADYQADDSIFGYQEHWAEYRYMPNRVTGLARPDVAGALDFVTLANDFSNLPQMGPGWITENRDSLSRCLATGATGPDYLASFYFDITAIRELPAYTIPGLVDHFGVM